MLKRVKVAEGNHERYLKPCVETACDVQDSETLPAVFPRRDPKEDIVVRVDEGRLTQKRKRVSDACAAIEDMRTSTCRCRRTTTH